MVLNFTLQRGSKTESWSHFQPCDVYSSDSPWTFPRLYQSLQVMLTTKQIPMKRRWHESLSHWEWRNVFPSNNMCELCFCFATLFRSKGHRNALKIKFDMLHFILAWGQNTDPSNRFEYCWSPFISGTLSETHYINDLHTDECLKGFILVHF